MVGLYAEDKCGRSSNSTLHIRYLQCHNLGVAGSRLVSSLLSRWNTIRRRTWIRAPSCQNVFGRIHSHWLLHLESRTSSTCLDTDHTMDEIPRSFSLTGLASKFKSFPLFRGKNSAMTCDPTASHSPKKVITESKKDYILSRGYSANVR